MIHSLVSSRNQANMGIVEQRSLSNAWFDSETAPYALPTARNSIALNPDLELSVNRQPLRQQACLDDRVSQSAFLTATPKVKNQSAANVLRRLRSNAQESSAASDRDLLTGLDNNQAIVSTQNNIALASSAFDSTYGYGLVNAARAVALSIGSRSAFADVPDWGGMHWGNDRVKAQEAWNRGFRGQGVTVAVIDSGVDISHPDLNDNIWRNRGEIAGDSIDNDQNGYVDDVFGWNFGIGQNNNNVTPGTTDPAQSHGTHVAGTIAAEHNQVGTTGIAPNAKIMAIRLGNVATSSDGAGRFTNRGNLAQAIRYAVDNGARVINLSLGTQPTQEVVDALAYAASRNVITVSAAGNSGASSPGSPARYATHFGISVGAIDRNNTVADFSNGAGFDSRMQHVVAPGVGIWSTVPTRMGSYAIKSGTSMAAPHVAGVIALMLSANPNLTHAQVRYILTQSATA
ncbi:MAG: hypothetical protein Kow00121_36480 [Elainellaceae cyanobacterium]